MARGIADIVRDVAQQRTQRVQARQQNRTDRQQTRQSNRAIRQKQRQDSRTQRTMARQTRRTVKEIQKGQSGFYSPEGQAARFAGIVDVTTAGTEAGKTIAAGIATQGASLAAEGTLDQLGGFLGGIGGGGGMAPQAAPMPNTQMDNNPFSARTIFSNPVVLGSIALGGFLLYRTLTR